MALVSSSRTDVSRTAILAYIGAQGPASRAQLARQLGVSPALITQLARDLIADGLIEDLDATTSAKGGRPARLLGLVSLDVCAIGIKIAPDHIALVDVAIDGSVLRSATEDFDARSHTAASALVSHVRQFIDEGDRWSLLGVGVGLPGTVAEQGIGIVDSTQLGWNQVPLGAMLRRELEVPVVVENNVNALTVAEKLFGQGMIYDDFLVVTIGDGVGAGVVSGGSILRGHGGGVGDMGHIPTIPDGPLCQCGNRGCLEAVIEQNALVRAAVGEGIVPSGSTIDEFRAAADGGDEGAASIYGRAGQLLGRAVAGVVNMLDPQLVVIQGEGVAAWEHWEREFEPALRGALIPSKRSVPVSVGSWQDDRWAQGAAALVLATPFDARGVAGEQGRLMRERFVATTAGDRP